jgi:glutamyl-tRNA synthetase
MPDRLPDVDDRIHGRVPGGCGGDIVVRRTDGLYAYHLAVVVDDAADGVTDVLRGDDLLPSTSRQVVLASMLELPVPAYAHVPLVVDADGVRLAKRHASLTIRALREAGATPQALVGAMAVSAGIADGRACRPRQLVDGFDIARIPSAPWAPDEGALVTAGRG